MPRPAWKSDTCVPCRKRKVKCDKGQPSCSGCLRSGIRCGYAAQNGNIVETPPRSTSTAPAANRSSERVLYQALHERSLAVRNRSPSPGYQNRVSVLSSFLTDFIPVHSGALQIFSWFEKSPHLLGENRVIDFGLTALSLAFVGQRDRDQSLINQSLVYYQRLDARVRVVQHDTVERVALATILGMYEMFCPIKTSSWLLHVRAACSMLSQCGPVSPIDPSLSCLVRALGFYDSCGRRKPTSPIYSRPVIFHPEVEPFEQLLAIVMPLSVLENHCDRLREDTTNEIIYQEFLALFSTTYTQLQTFYIAFLDQYRECPFTEIRALPGISPRPPDYLDRDDVFTLRVTFSNSYSFQILLICWTAFFMLHYEAQKVMRMRQTPLPYTSLPILARRYRPWVEDECSITSWLGDAELANPDAQTPTEFFAERVCRATAFSDGYNDGSVMKLITISPLWLMHQYFLVNGSRSRAAWCDRILARFPLRGAGYGLAISRFSHRQYPALD